MKFIEGDVGSIKKRLDSLALEEEQVDSGVDRTVTDIRDRIRSGGFKALCEYSRKFDNFDLTEENFRVSPEEIDKLASKIDPQLSRALETAIERVTQFHKYQYQRSYDYYDSHNNKMGQRVLSLDAAAVYVPGGDALYPSTIYMTVVPAQIAGVKRIVLLSPPRTFEMSPEVARLVQLLEIKEVYRIGGAQAIMAAAYGCGSLKPVDKIVGPGNQYVAKAKEKVYGKVDIDMIAGPSEICVVADTNKDEDIPMLAADLLSQAEHGPAGFTRSVIIGTDKDYLKKVEEEVYLQVESLPLKESALKSLKNRGLSILVENIFQAMEISNYLAPEHLELFSENASALLNMVRHAGSVFLGKNTPESVGDYLGGPNHVLPTEGTARFFSPLGVYDFQKKVSWIQFSRDSLRHFSRDITSIARSEGLEAHARSVEKRL